MSSYDEALFGHPKLLERLASCDVVRMDSSDDPGFVHHDRTVDELLAHGEHQVLSPARRVHDAAPDFGNVCGIQTSCLCLVAVHERMEEQASDRYEVFILEVAHETHPLEVEEMVPDFLPDGRPPVHMGCI